MKKECVFVFLIITILPAYATIEQIPEWIKNNAKWWAENEIDDVTFLQGIEYMIENGIIDISSSDNKDKSEKQIPEWIKNNAKWWAENEIDDVTFLQGIEYMIENGIIDINKNQENSNSKKFKTDLVSDFFEVWIYKDDLYFENGVLVASNFYFKLIPEFEDLYEEIGITNKEKASVVVLPVFTSSAYSKNGFYDYYNGKCKNCTTTNIVENNLQIDVASQLGAKVLEILGYEIISDIDVDKNPDILKKYDKVILLHNEYVTKKEFDAITNHPKVIYLYPNALYAEVKVDYSSNSITLLRGHGFPEPEIVNGFDWKFDNTHPYEYDKECNNWKFYDIPNGKMLNCYPEHIIASDKELLKKIKEI